MILLGAPIFTDSDDPCEHARLHVARGYRAAYCSGRLQAIAQDDPAAVRDAFAEAGVMLAEWGVWGNLIGPEPDKREANIARIIDALKRADALGVACVVDFLGTFAPDSAHDPHPDGLGPRAFDAAVDVTRHVLDVARPTRTKFCLEMMPCCVPADAATYRRLITAVDRPQFGVHLDPVNIVTSPQRYFDTAGLLRACFAELGEHIVSCHAKDTILRTGLTVHIDEVAPGRGELDYRAFLRELDGLGRDVPLMLEHLKTEAEYDAAAAYIRQVAEEVGVAISRPAA